QFPRLLARLIVSVPLFFRLRKALSAIQLKEEKPILVHLNSSTLVIAALAAKSLAIPLIWHIREPLSKGYLVIRRALLRYAIGSLPDQIIAISQHDAAQLGNSFPKERLTVVHNFVNFN